MTATLLVLPKDGNIQISGTGLEMSGQFTREEQPLEPAQHPALQEILEVAVFCNNAALPRQTDTDHNEDAQAAKMIGDPMEVALLVAGSKAGIQRDDLLERFPEEREEAFDPRRKMMATFHRSDDAYRVAVKGAVEAVLDVCSQIRQGDQVQELTPAMRKDWNQRNDQMAENGLRVLAFATKISESADEDPYQDLQFLGLVGLIDPPREDVQEAIKVCKQAGVKVIMITGDQIVTARNVGKQVGLLHEDEEMKAQLGSCLDEVDENAAEETRQLLDVPIFARVSPEQKLRLIALHQQHGEIVAMTGDGVNDAPALEKADIGIAMGQHGTQVAREAADMILKDDAFSTIIEAVRYGRVIFGNIRKFVTYLLSGNAGEILIVGLATLFQAPLPLLPLQILFLNFVADVFPALALGVGVGTEAVMQQKPRDPKEPVMTRRHWITILNYGVLIALTVLAAFGLAYRWFGFDSSQAVTISFLTLAFARLWHVFNMRAYNTQLWRNEVTTNPWVWGALLLCLGLLFSAIYIPVLAQILKLVPPTGFQWLIILGMSLIPLLVGQIVKFARVGMAEST